MLALVAPTEDAVPTGGHVYNGCLLREWAAMDVPVVCERVGGRWPNPSAAQRADVQAALTRHSVVLVDGLVGAACPDEVAYAESAGVRVVILVHLPLPAESGLAGAERSRLADCEERALNAASGVVTTSGWAAGELRRRYGLARVHVARPGADRAPVAPGSAPPHLLVLAAFTPGKNHATLLRALERLADLDWTAAFVGRRPADSAAAQAWDRQAAASPVRSRLEIPGPQLGHALEEHWSRTDLLVLVSQVETFGLVVNEAFGHGIPAVVGTGTGAVEALLGDGLGSPPGAAADPSDPESIADTLRGFLADRQLRDEWRRSALTRRRHLRPWSEAARDVLAALSVAPDRRDRGG